MLRLFQVLFYQHNTLMKLVIQAQSGLTKLVSSRLFSGLLFALALYAQLLDQLLLVDRLERNALAGVLLLGTHRAPQVLVFLMSHAYSFELLIVVEVPLFVDVGALHVVYVVYNLMAPCFGVVISGKK